MAGTTPSCAKTLSVSGLLTTVSPHPPPPPPLASSSTPRNGSGFLRMAAGSQRHPHTPPPWHVFIRSGRWLMHALTAAPIPSSSARHSGVSGACWTPLFWPEQPVRGMLDAEMLIARELPPAAQEWRQAGHMHWRRSGLADWTGTGAWQHLQKTQSSSETIRTLPRAAAPCWQPETIESAPIDPAA